MTTCHSALVKLISYFVKYYNVKLIRSCFQLYPDWLCVLFVTLNQQHSMLCGMGDDILFLFFYRFMSQYASLYPFSEDIDMIDQLEPNRFVRFSIYHKWIIGILSAYPSITSRNISSTFTQDLVRQADINQMVFIICCAEIITSIPVDFPIFSV